VPWSAVEDTATFAFWCEKKRTTVLSALAVKKQCEKKVRKFVQKIFHEKAVNNDREKWKRRKRRQ
jgi:hypothetical protein